MRDCIVNIDYGNNEENYRRRRIVRRVRIPSRRCALKIFRNAKYTLPARSGGAASHFVHREFREIFRVSGLPRNIIRLGNYKFCIRRRPSSAPPRAPLFFPPPPPPPPPHRSPPPPFLATATHKYRIDELIAPARDSISVLNKCKDARVIYPASYCDAQRSAESPSIRIIGTERWNTTHLKWS